jgi:2-dehydropantoate 2-reductase
MHSEPAIDPPSTTWHVLGSGAMACLWAAALRRGRYAVRMIPRHPPAAAAYHDLTLLTATGVERHEVLHEGGNETGTISRLLVCTKAYDVETAVRAQAARLAADAVVVLLQNGMGFQQVVRAALRRARVFAAVTTEGAFLEGPLRVRHAGRGLTTLGLYPRSANAEAAALATELGSGGLEVEAVGDIETALWRKLAVSCAINPLTALHRCPNGALLDDPALHAEFAALCTELEQVFAALGHTSIAATLRAQASAVARATATNRSSMLQDIESGRRTEIEYISGHLCRAATAAGVAAPLNQAVYAAIRGREAAAWHQHSGEPVRWVTD